MRMVTAAVGTKLPRFFLYEQDEKAHKAARQEALDAFVAKRYRNSACSSPLAHFVPVHVASSLSCM
jgi:hypothetical protein